MTRFFILALCVVSSCKTTNTFYIVRHAEKEPGAAMTATTTRISDVPLSAAGKERARALKDLLVDKKIKEIFSTHTIRTLSTAKPLSEARGIPIRFCDAVDTNFLNEIKDPNTGNILILGHSNKVDDLVNGITGQKQLSDLADDQSGDLFVIRKKGSRYHYQRKDFGK